MVDITLDSASRQSLCSLVGDELISLECTGIDRFRGTYAYALIQTDRHRLQISNVQEPIPGFDVFGDFPVLRCRLLHDDESFTPFTGMIMHKYPLRGTVRHIKLIDDAITPQNPEESLTRTRAVELVTDHKTLAIVANIMFDETLFVYVGDADIPSAEEIARHWKENPEDAVQVRREISQLR